ncbi:MAG: exodeoxyribonuclease VII small subunit [Gallionella sp.]|nr:exodeoxyribonuclease VII small subunit [Gallionella sp.]
MSGTSHKTPAKNQKSASFESAMAELEKIVAEMESGKLTLEDSLAAYKRGAELLSFCRARLDDAQAQVRVLEEGELSEFPATGAGPSTSTGAGQD